MKPNVRETVEIFMAGSALEERASFEVEGSTEQPLGFYPGFGEGEQ
jgi:hypothetical protein